MVRLSRGDRLARVLAGAFILLGIVMTVLVAGAAPGDRLLVVGGICFPGAVHFGISGWGQHLTVTELRLLVVTPFRRHDIRRADIAGVHRTDGGHVAIDLTDGRRIAIPVGVAETVSPWANRWAAQSRTLDFIRRNVLAEPAVAGGPATTWRWRTGVVSLAVLAVVALGTAFVFAKNTR